MPFYNRCPRLTTGELLQGGRARPRRDSHGRACASRADGGGCALDDFPANAAQAEVLQDRYVPPANARALAEAIPGAKLRLLEDAGHLVFVERFTDVNREVVRFLKSSEA